MKIRFIDSIWQDDAQPGDATWASSGGEGITDSATGEPVPEKLHAALVYRCPGCNDIRSVPIKPYNNGMGAQWDWDGNVELPTLTPSIQQYHCKCPGLGWHGYLTAGEWITL